MNETQEPDLPQIQFEQLANLFVKMGVFASPSELHGMLCGRLALGDIGGEQEWLRGVASYLEQQRIDDEDSKRLLLDLFTATQQQMLGTGFDLELLLPDDEARIAQRIDSIGLWCQGFLAGFGSSKLQVLSEEAREALGDLSEIINIEQGELEQNEESEEDFMQVLEYVRMVAILIYSEVMGSDNKASAQPPPSIH